MDEKIKINKINFYFHFVYIFNTKKDSKYLFNSKELIFSVKLNMNTLKKKIIVLQKLFLKLLLIMLKIKPLHHLRNLILLIIIIKWIKYKIYIIKT